MIDVVILVALPKQPIATSLEKGPSCFWHGKVDIAIDTLTAAVLILWLYNICMNVLNTQQAIHPPLKGSLSIPLEFYHLI